MINIPKIKLLGMVGAGTAGVVGVGFGINELSKSKAKKFSKLEINPATGSNKKSLVDTGRILKVKSDSGEEVFVSSIKEWDSLRKNRDEFINDHDLMNKKREEIEKLFKDVLHYTDFESSKINPRGDESGTDDFTEYYASRAIRGLCSEGKTGVNNETLKKYCKEYELV